MPMCTVMTNMARGDIPVTFCEDFARCVAETLGKPLEVVSVTVISDVMMSMGVSKAPCVRAQIHAIDVFDDDTGKTGYAKLLMEFLMKTLNLPVEKTSLEFYSITPNNVGILLYMEEMAKK